MINLSKNLRSCLLCRHLKPSLTGGFSSELKNSSHFNPIAAASLSLVNSSTSQFRYSSSTSSQLSQSLVTDAASPISDLTVSQLPEVFGLSAWKWWAPSGAVQEALIYMTDSVGVSWPIALFSCAALTRLLMLPVTVGLKRLAIKSHNIAPQRLKIQLKEGERVLNRVKSGAPITARHMMSIHNEGLQFNIKHKCSIYHNYPLIMYQAPIIISMFLAIRDMGERAYTGLATDCFWIPNLCLSDPFFVLPALNLATVYFIIRSGIDGPTPPFLTSKKFQTGMLCAFPVAVYMMNSYFPSALIMYWLSSNCIGFVVNKVMKIDGVRHLCRIPKKIQHPEGFNEHTKIKEINQKIMEVVKQQQHRAQAK